VPVKVPFYGLVGLQPGRSQNPDLGVDELMEALVREFDVGVVGGESLGMGASSFRISYGMLHEAAL